MYRRRWRGPKITVRVGGKVVALLFITFLLFTIAGATFTQIQRVSNAYYFSTDFIQPRSGMPFNRPINDSQVRLVTEELAVSPQKKGNSHFKPKLSTLHIHPPESNSPEPVQSRQEKSDSFNYQRSEH